MWERAVAGLYPTAMVVVLAGVVIVVFHLAVGVAVVVIAGHPMEGGTVIAAGLSYIEQWCQDPISLARAAHQVT